MGRKEKARYPPCDAKEIRGICCSRQNDGDIERSIKVKTSEPFARGRKAKFYGTSDLLVLTD